MLSHAWKLNMAFVHDYNFLQESRACLFDWFVFDFPNAVWADADTWFERQQQEEEMQRIQAENKAAMQAAEELHRKKMAQEREGEKEDDAELKDDPMAMAEAEALKQKSWSCWF